MNIYQFLRYNSKFVCGVCLCIEIVNLVMGVLGMALTEDVHIRYRLGVTGQSQPQPARVNTEVVRYQLPLA
jgi:hypothetical protein